MRSLLFVPGDAEAKLAKALGSGADVLLLDLEDSVAAGAKARAREVVRGFLAGAPAGARPRLYARVNAFDSGLLDADLDAVIVPGLDGVMLPKCAGGTEVTHLGAKLAVREAEAGLPDGGTAILAIATETAASLFRLGSYAGSSRRLAGLAWGAEDLSADLGAETNRELDGTYAPAYRLARVLTLAGAAAAGVAPVDSVFTAYRDEAGLRAEAEAARREGFTAKLAIHPAQVPVINAVFTPSPEVLARARAVVAAFAAHPGAGVVGVDGQMLDRPHLLRAERVLARAGGVG